MPAVPTLIVTPTQVYATPGQSGVFIVIGQSSGSEPTFTITSSDPSVCSPNALLWDVGTWGQAWQVSGPAIEVPLLLGEYGTAILTIVAPDGSTAEVFVDVIGNVKAFPANLVFDGPDDAPKVITVDQPGNLEQNYIADNPTGSGFGVESTRSNEVTIAPNAVGSGTIDIVGLGGKKVTVNVSVLGAPSYMVGRTMQQAVAIVRLKTNEYVKPLDSDIVALLNAGLNEVNDELEVVRKLISFPINPGQSTILMPGDVTDIVKVSFSQETPTQPGVIEYELTELGVGIFIDQTGSFPTTGGGPLQSLRLLEDSEGQKRFQVYPQTLTGYINVYYWARVRLWDPNNPLSTSNFDAGFEWMAILFACYNVCESRENLRRAEWFKDDLDTRMVRKMETARRRDRIRGAQVRDVTSSSYLVSPPWFRA